MCQTILKLPMRDELSLTEALLELSIDQELDFQTNQTVDPARTLSRRTDIT